MTSLKFPGPLPGYGPDCAPGLSGLYIKHRMKSIYHVIRGKLNRLLPDKTHKIDHNYGAIEWLMVPVIIETCMFLC